LVDRAAFGRAAVRRAAVIEHAIQHDVAACGRADLRGGRLDESVGRKCLLLVLTPTISQRRVKSSIAVTSGQTVLLAGMISETENRQPQGIPILDSIPGMGDAFSHARTNRTDPVIRPTVIKDPVDAHVIAEEMRSKMNSRLVGTSNPGVVTTPPGVAR
jgi:Flp pilus assembly secretin CpaC